MHEKKQGFTDETSECSYFNPSTNTSSPHLVLAVHTATVTEPRLSHPLRHRLDEYALLLFGSWSVAASGHHFNSSHEIVIYTSSYSKPSPIFAKNNHLSKMETAQRSSIRLKIYGFVLAGNKATAYAILICPCPCRAHPRSCAESDTVQCSA